MSSWRQSKKQSNEFTVVIPIRDEEKMLPITLPSIYNLHPHPSEVILLFDNCRDRSLQVALAIAERCHGAEITRFVEVSDVPSDWGMRECYIRREAYKLATSEIILSSGADIILNGHANTALNLFKNKKVGVVSFGCLDYPITFKTVISNFLQSVNFFQRFIQRVFGPYFFRKSAWVEYEDQCKARECTCAEDVLLWSSVKPKFSIKVLRSQTLHLRRVESRERNYVKGRSYRANTNRGFLFTLLVSVFLLRPSLIVGYIHERREELKRNVNRGCLREGRGNGEERNVNPVEMFEKAEQFVRQKGFGWEIDWCEKRPPFSHFTKSAFLREYAWVILNAGMKNEVIEKKWNGISEAFFGFDVEKIVNNDEEALAAALAVFGNKGKMKAIVEVACKIHDFGYLWMQQKISLTPLTFLDQLPYIGEVTKFHLARNLGFDFIKPDRHLVRLASKFDMTPFGLCNLIHEKTGRRLGTIDVILWRFCEQKGRLEDE